MRFLKVFEVNILLFFGKKMTGPQWNFTGLVSIGFNWAIRAKVQIQQTVTVIVSNTGIFPVQVETAGKDLRARRALNFKTPVSNRKVLPS